MDKYYTIKIHDCRHILWCDDHWYETSSSPMYLFKKEEAVHIIKDLLPMHFVYKSSIIDEDGNEENFNFLKKKKKGNFNVTFNGNGFSISLGSLAV